MTEGRLVAAAAPVGRHCAALRREQLSSDQMEVVKTAWQILWDSRKVIKSGCTARLGSVPKLQCSWEGPYKAMTWINDVVYWIQWHPRARMMVVHFDTLSPYLGASSLEEGAM
jgi:hypothetical protein